MQPIKIYIDLKTTVIDCIMSSATVALQENENKMSFNEKYTILN